MEAGSAQCAKHQFDLATAVCGSCKLTFCEACLVFAFGPHKPPLCIPCALTVGGVRRGGAAPKVSWRERRARRKALAAQAEAQAAATLEAALAAEETHRSTPFDKPTENPLDNPFDSAFEMSFGSALGTPFDSALDAPFDIALAD